MRVKRALAVLIALSLSIVQMPLSTYRLAERQDVKHIAASAAETRSGTCGVNLTWNLTTDGVLSISGTGAMYNWKYSRISGNDSITFNGDSVPWYDYRYDIRKIIVNDGVYSVGDLAFALCINVESVQLPDTLKKIGSYAFYQCNWLTSINIPEGVSEIGKSVFYNCKALETITLPASLKTLEDDSITHCDSLSSIDVNANNQYFSSIDGVLFSKDGTKLLRYPPQKSNKSYSIPDGVQEIGRYAFYRSNNLKTITMTDSVKTIAYEGFASCSQLESIGLSDAIETIASYAFGYCGALKSITLPSKLNSVDGNAFAYCNSLATVHIPAGTESISPGVFDSCNNLAEITVADNNPNYCSISGVLYNKNVTTLISYPAAKSDERFEIPEGVREIAASAFNNASNLKSVALPSKLQSIGGLAFHGCKKLESLSIPESVTAIGSQAFSWCTSLQQITIPRSVIAIQYLTFYACDSMSEITIENQACEIYDSADTISSSALIYGYSNSTAQSYAEKFDRIFVSLGEGKEPSTEATTEDSAIVSTTTATTTSSGSETTTTTVSSQNNTIVTGVDNYSFLNESAYFHSDSYHLSDKMLSILSQKADNMEWETIVDKMQGSSGWQGSCYGMSAVEILAKIGLMSASSVSTGTKHIYDWESPVNNTNVEDIINYYHMLQYSAVFKSKADKFMRKTNQERIKELIKMASEVENGGNPILVCFNYSKTASKRLDAGHAVVAYGVEYGSWTYSGKYDCRVLISDPNVSGFDNAACIYINTDTYHWEIPYYQTKGYSCSNTNQNNKDNPYAQIRFATNDETLIDTFGYLRTTSVATKEDKESTISIESSTSNFGVGYYNSSAGDINDSECELIFYSGLLGSGASMGEVNAILPKTDVPYEYYEKSINPFHVAIEYTNSKLQADVSNGSYAIYQPDESVEFHGEDSSYTLSIVANEGYYPTDWYKIEVSGYKADFAKLSMAENGYIISGDALKEGIFITASNRTDTARLNLMTDAESIFIYEIDKNTLGAKLDKNGDGIYETKFTPTYIGDVNRDSSITVVDVIALQKYLLAVNTLSKEQFISADLNQDGSVDVFDLTLLKRTLLHIG